MSTVRQTPCVAGFPVGPRAKKTVGRGPVAEGRSRVRPARDVDREVIAGLIAGADGLSKAEREATARRVANRLGRAERDGWRCLVLADDADADAQQKMQAVICSASR